MIPSPVVFVGESQPVTDHPVRIATEQQTLAEAQTHRRCQPGPDPMFFRTREGLGQTGCSAPTGRTREPDDVRELPTGVRVPQVRTKMTCGQPYVAAEVDGPAA